MNFFKAQDKARRNTSWLIFLFILAIVSLVILTNLLLIGTFAYMESGESGSFIRIFKSYLETDIIIMVSSAVSLLIILGSLYKALSLSKGGQTIAEMLGGQVIPQSTTEHDKRQLLNIVEEMSIAAGMPIPKVYLLEESSVNAFAAGESQSSAVIGVTRGAITQLSRDELQGVIAHEFSHILNGDMHLNLNLISTLHGILLIGIIGEYILNSMRYRSSGKKNSASAIIIIGIGLMIIGYAGTFFGKWIKASVSRQREFLADASAVQFTRNKDTIAGALKKIGGLENGSLLETPSASQYSHAYFADGVSHYFDSMFATHPPLKKRIKKIDPAWDGRYIVTKHDKKTNKEETKETPAGSIAGVAVAAAILSSTEQIISQIGTINDYGIQYAHELIANIPEKLRAAAQSPYSARAIVYTLLIREQKNKNDAWENLKKHADETIPALTKKLLTESQDLNEQLILPLLELCVNTLKELSENQYKQFSHTINAIVEHDKTVDLNEWVIQRLVLQQLDEHFSLRKPAKAKHAYLGAVKTDAEVMLSLIAYIEHNDDEISAQRAFEVGKKDIGAHAFKIIPKKELSLKKLNDSIDQLMQLKPLLKSRILKACAALIMSDGKTTQKGLELFRTISSNLDCPSPPLRR